MKTPCREVSLFSVQLREDDIQGQITPDPSQLHRCLWAFQIHVCSKQNHKSNQLKDFIQPLWALINQNFFIDNSKYLFSFIQHNWQLTCTVAMRIECIAKHVLYLHICSCSLSSSHPLSHSLQSRSRGCWANAPHRSGISNTSSADLEHSECRRWTAGQRQCGKKWQYHGCWYKLLKVWYYKSTSELYRRVLSKPIEHIHHIYMQTFDLKPILYW